MEMLVRSSNLFTTSKAPTNMQIERLSISYSSTHFPYTTATLNFTRGPEESANLDPRPSEEFMIMMYILRTITSLLSITGNSLTIAAIVKFKKLHSCTNILIASLAAADFLGATLTPFFIFHDVYRKDASIYIATCLAEKWLSMVSTRENIQGILLIAIDRFLFIAYPFRYPLLVTHSRVFAVIIAGWIFGLLEMSIIVSLTQDTKIGVTCKYFVILPKWVSYYLTGLLILYITLTAVLYSGIARIAVKQRRAIEAQAQATDPALMAKIKKGNRVSKMMFTVLGVYICCYLPSAVTSIILQYKMTVIGVMVDQVASLIFWVNTWVNPIIYAWKSREFKTAFIKLLGKTPQSGNPTADPSTHTPAGN